MNANDAASFSSSVSRLPSSGSSAIRRAWAICAKDAAQELRRKIAAASIFFFAATAVTLVSFGVGPFGLPPEARDGFCSALLWIILFFCAATGLPRAFVREEETGTAYALRKVVPSSLTLAGKTLFNYVLFLAITAVTVPAFAILLEWRMGSLGALAAVMVLGGSRLSGGLTFLAARVAPASPKHLPLLRHSLPPAASAPPRGDRRAHRRRGRGAAGHAVACHRGLRWRRHVRRLPAGLGRMGRLTSFI